MVFLCPTENDQIQKTVGETLINAIIENDQQRLRDTLYASASSGIEYLDSYENTPLLIASYLGRSDLVRILLQHGANYKRINLYGKLCVHHIRYISFLSISSILEFQLNISICYCRSKCADIGHLFR